MAGLVLDGTNWAQTPDVAALDITGDLDVRVACAAADWTPSGLQVFVGKLGASGTDIAFIFYLNTDKTLEFIWSPDGTTQKLTQSTVAPTVSDGFGIGLRATLDVDNGSGGASVKFYTKAITLATSAADIASDSGWTQLGSTRTLAGTSSVFNSGSPMRVGSSVEAAFFVGEFYAMVLKNGIAGTTVANPDFYTNALPFTDAAGRAWTLEPPMISLGIAEETDEALPLASVTSFRPNTPTYTGREPKLELGCGSYVAILTERGGGNPIARLPFSNLSWSRSIDSVSSASVSTAITSQELYDTCCAILTRADSYDGEIDPWSHEISIYRSGILVWCGPITGMSGSFDDVNFECRDLLAWFDKRWLPTDRDVISDLSSIFELFALDALNQDPSPNIDLVGYAINTVNRRTVTMHDFVKASSLLNELGQDGLDFTAVGRQVFFGNLDNLALDMGVDLHLPRYGVAGASWEKRGSVMATQQTVMGNPPGGSTTTIHATVGGQDPKYGLLQEAASESFMTVQAFLANAARSRLEMVKKPPRFLDVALAPQAPFTIDQLIAGFLITPGFDIGCFRASEQMRLHEMSVSFSVDEEGEESETITATLVPKGQPDFGFGFDTGLAEV
jgi:hypothetical protein